MNYCTNCGQNIDNDDLYCTNCGHQLISKKDNNTNKATTYSTANTSAYKKNSSLDTAIKVFMILACIADSSFFLIMLIWTIPMTISAWNKMENGEEISVGFKICYLLFVGKLAGILLLCRGE